MRNFGIGILFLVFLSTLFQLKTFAQTQVSVGIATNVPLSGKVLNGEIISGSNKGYYPSTTPYDAQMAGVISLNPAVSLDTIGIDNAYPLISNGTVLVRVATINGPIHEKDPITSSSIAGVGMRATRTGYILGTAVGSYTVSNKNQVGEIIVTLNRHYDFVSRRLSNSIFDIFAVSELAAYESPSVVFKYAMAAFIIILAIILGFLSYGRVAALGIEALGRNPLASKSINYGILLNVTITVAIIVIGFIISYAILRL